MAIGVSKFQRPSRADDTPFWEGLSQALKRQSIRNQNRKQEEELPYIAPMKAAELLLKQLQGEYYGPNMQSQIDSRQVRDRLTSENIKGRQIQNEFLPQKLRAYIDNLNKRTNFVGNGGRGSVGFQDQARTIDTIGQTFGVDYQTASDIFSAYVDGSKVLSNGEPVPEPTGLIKDQLAKVFKRNSPVQTQNKATSTRVLSDIVNGIDIEPLLHFAGPKGRLKAASESLNDSFLGNSSDIYNRYKSFKGIDKYFIQDALRQAFGTSVVPGYVQSTLGLAADPSQVWHSSPKQVKENWEKTKKLVNELSKKYEKESRQGIGGGDFGEISESFSDNDPLGLGI